ncbi:SDR family NAD(P)-dependent oxidoreductase [Nonomuraea sp. NPDC003707]
MRDSDLAAQTGCHFVQADVAVLEDNQAAVAEVANRFGRLDTVCLNAGVPGGQGLGDDFDAEKYHRAMRVNLDDPVYGANAAIPNLRQGGGAILITSSLAGVTASPDLYYATAKHALIGLTRSLACSCSPMESPSTHSSTHCARGSLTPVSSPPTAARSRGTASLSPNPTTSPRQ